MKLEPVWLVKTLRPCCFSSSVTILVVVVLPLVPEMATTPEGRRRRILAQKRGLMRSTTSPGRAEPPWPRNLESCWMILPSRMIGNMGLLYTTILGMMRVEWL